MRARNLVPNYSKKFGIVSDERCAEKIGIQVLDEIYSDCSKTESPFIVRYNKKADAWIVQGTLLPNTLGGVGSVAIKRNTGEILLIMHTK